MWDYTKGHTEEKIIHLSTGGVDDGNNAMWLKVKSVAYLNCTMYGLRYKGLYV